MISYDKHEGLEAYLSINRSLKKMYSKRVGKNIRNVREEYGYTQSRLAGKVDLTANYICLVEKGERSASPKTLFKIARALNKGVEYFLEKHRKSSVSGKKPARYKKQSLLELIEHLERRGHTFEVTIKVLPQY